MRSAGVAITTVDDATGLKAMGVTPAFVKRLAEAWYTNLTARQLTSLAAAVERWLHARDVAVPDAQN
jgi:hypothetical protein